MNRFLSILAGASFLMLAGTGCCCKCLDACGKTAELTPEMRAKNAAAVCDFLKEAQVYYIATVDGNAPQIRPFGTAHIFEGKLYIQTARKKRVYQQISANRRVAVCAFIPAKGEWLRLSGILCDDDRLSAQKALLDAHPSLKKLYKAGDGNNQVLYFRDAEARFCSFSHPEKTLFF